MTVARIQNALGEWVWLLRPSHIVVRNGDEVEDIEAIGPTATVDPNPIIEGPWWGQKPWFLENLAESQAQFLRDAGYPPKLLAQAAEGLRRLLPHDLCVRLAKDHETRMFIAPLYQSFVPFMRSLLGLGCDLVEATPWDDEHLLKRLLIPAEHWGAATEVSVAAALRRSGLRTEREPKGRDEKRPEFLVHLDFWRYFIEVKTNNLSLAETRAERLDQALTSFHGDLADRGVVAVEGSDELHALLQDPTAPLSDDMGSQLRKDLRAFLEGGDTSSPLVTGRHVVGRFLVVEVVADRGERGTSVGLAPETSDEEDATRVIRQLRKAAKQIPAAAHGFAVVEIGSVTNIVMLQEVTEAAFTITPDAFEPIRGVVFHASTSTETGHRLRRIFGGAAPGRRLDAGEEKVLRALLLPRFEGSEIVRETLYGTGRFKLSEFTIETPGGPVR